jgi:head-tail adaptor
MVRGVSLNWPLTLEQRQRVPDGGGGFAETWVVLGQMWGEVHSRGVRATEVEAGALSRIRYRIVVRGAADGSVMRPKTGQRFRNGAKAYAIDSVSEMDASAVYLECWAREEVLA